MKPLLNIFLLLAVAGSAFAASAVNFKDHLGLQLYSLRDKMKESPIAALDLAKSYGVKEVELAGTGNLTPEQFASELKKRGLVPISGHFGYNVFDKDVAAVIRDAKTLGLKYVNVPYPPVGKDKIFSEELAHQTAAKFNEWGAACKAAGLTFGYHPHGLEFRPTASGGTVFDILVRETKPELVSFQMDVYWVYYAGQDPVKLLEKYPNRWSTLHIKDMLKGLATGLHTGGTPPTAKVTVGMGQIDYASVLRAAQKIGVKHYFLEDETPTPLQCIPDSFKYLRALKL
ncbi:MAG: sugar phosphate isomerase/epimerase [Opitutaceae bacterium]|nr:sugar phosphate isomerase/epimerase [Opitutaceae bacterium]